MANTGTSVFQHQLLGSTAGNTPPYCSYPLAVVLRSSWLFELNNYVADCRRRSKFKIPTKYALHNTKHITQLIPKEQLNYLLWCKTSKSSTRSMHGRWLWSFKLNNYIADRRRRAKLKTHRQTSPSGCKPNLPSKRQVDQAEERAAHFSNQEGDPDASVAIRQDGDSEHLSRGMGISKGASTINSELTNSFNENRKMKYAATKLELSKGKAKIADQEAEIAKLRRRLAALSNAQGDTEVSNNETDWQNLSSSDDDQMDIDVDVDGSSSDDDDSDSSTSDDDSTTNDEGQAEAQGNGQGDDSSEEDDSSASSSSSDSSSSSSSTASDAKVKSSADQFDMNEYDEAAAQRPRSSSKSTDSQSGDGEGSSDA